MRWILKVVGVSAFLASALFARSLEYERAHNLYQRTEYQQSLTILQSIKPKDAAEFQLLGQNYFMLGEYKKASEMFDKALAIDPNNAEVLHWQGRTYGRRAETANPFAAPGLASKTRAYFERSVELDPTNKEALGDLLDFYLEAPGFLGGGMQKAETLARMIGTHDPAEGHYAQGLIDEHRKEYEAAEQQFRRAAELAPRQVGRVLDLAKFLAKRGRIKESEALFDQAARMAPDSPRVMFERANTYIKEKRNLDQARELLERYINSQLTPDDPPREDAEALLKKLGA